MGFSSETDASSAKTKKETDVTTSGTTTEQLKLDDEAIQKIIEDTLASSGGLKDIFGGEQSAGIFNSSVSAQAAGDFASKLVGELAKLQAVKEIKTDEQVDSRDVITEHDIEQRGSANFLFS